MSVFTISSSMLRYRDESGLGYYRSVLMPFTCGLHKVAKDEKGQVVDIYRNLPDPSGIIHCWLQLMTNEPSKFETIPVAFDQPIDEEMMFLLLCKSTKGHHKMIVYSIQEMKCPIDNDNCTEIEGTTIELLDRDKAALELSTMSTQNNINIINSVLANGNVSKSNNN